MRAAGAAGGRLPQIDGLRGLAIAAVVGFHAYARWNHVEPWDADPSASAFFARGWLGVQLFFLVSGFVIMGSLERSRSLSVFVRARWLRLFPAMLVASALLLAIAPLLPGRPASMPALRDVLPGLTFVEPSVWSALFGVEFASLEGVFWTLYVEVKFYIVVAFAFFVLSDRRGRVVPAIFLAWLGLSALAWLVPLPLPLVGAMGVLEALDARHYGWFALGIAFHRSVMGERGVTGEIVVLSVLCALGVAFAHAGRPSEFAALAVLCLAIAWLFAACLAPGSAARIMAMPLAVRLGLLSYPLYLVHENLVTGLAVELHAWAGDWPAVLYPVPGIAIALGLAAGIARAEPLVRKRLAAASSARQEPSLANAVGR